MRRGGGLAGAEVGGELPSWSSGGVAGIGEGGGGRRGAGGEVVTEHVGL